MATSEFDLKHGLQVGDDVLTHVVLGEVTAGDILEAQMEAERVVYQDGKPVTVTSPAMVGMLLLCRQIKRIGNMEGPIDISLLKKMHEEDFLVLETRSNELSDAVTDAAQELYDRGRERGDSARH